MKEEVKDLLRKKREEDEIEIENSLSNIVNDQFQNPKVLLQRFEKKVDTKSLMKISRYYVDDFVRTESSLSINIHSENLPPYFHKHDFVEIIYVHKGSCKQCIDNIDNIVVLGQGDAMILNPGTIHAVYPAEKDNYIIKIFMPEDFLYMNREATSSRESDSNYLFYHEKINLKYQYIIFNDVNVAVIDFYLENLIVEYCETNMYRLTAIKNCLSLIIIELFRRNPTYHVKKNIGIDQKILEYIEAKYDVVSLKELAEYIGYSEKYMSRLIKEIYGIGFSKLINSVRVKKGIYFLLNTDLTIEAVSHKLGFKHSSNFYRLMSSELGVTPNQIRRNGIVTK